jgi:hypothetical protein
MSSSSHDHEGVLDLTVGVMNDDDQEAGASEMACGNLTADLTRRVTMHLTSVSTTTYREALEAQRRNAARSIQANMTPRM